MCVSLSVFVCCVYVSVCACVCMRARARVCVCLCLCRCVGVYEHACVSLIAIINKNYALHHSQLLEETCKRKKLRLAAY